MRPRPILLLGTLLTTTMLAGHAVGQERHAYIVVDAQTNQILYEDNAQARRFPASITKVMTVYMIFEAIEQGRLSWDSRISFSRNASRQPPTKLGVAAGNSISVEDAVNALIIRSANDVATAVAENLAGSEQAFARQMTERARTLGMDRTQFRNASGLPDSSQFTTAEDLARLSIAIRRDFPQHFHMFSRTEFTFNGNVIYGHNRVLSTVDGVDGLKTGFTRASGYNLATTAGRDNQRLVTVVLGGASSAARNAEVTNLVETGFNTLGVRRYVMDVARPDTAGLYDRRDAGDLIALSSEVPVALMPSATVVMAGLDRSSREMTLPAGPAGTGSGWQPTVMMAANQPRQQMVPNLPMAQTPTVAPVVVMAASQMAGGTLADGEEDDGPVSVPVAVPASVMMAAVSQPAQALATGPVAVPVSVVQTTAVAPQTEPSVQLAAVTVETVSLTSGLPAASGSGADQPLRVALADTFAPPETQVAVTDLAAAPSAVETVTVTTGAGLQPVQVASLPSSRDVPGSLPGGETTEATPTVVALRGSDLPLTEPTVATVQMAEVTMPEPASSSIVATESSKPIQSSVIAVALVTPAGNNVIQTAAIDEPIIDLAAELTTMAENTAPVPSFDIPTGPALTNQASVTPTEVAMATTEAPTEGLAEALNEASGSMPVVAMAEATSAEAMPSEVTFRVDGDALPMAETQLAAISSDSVMEAASPVTPDQPAQDGEIRMADAGQATASPAPTVSLPADALALTEQLRREAAGREAQRLAAIQADEARQAAAARAAREAQARERQLAEQRAREARARQVAEQQAIATREREAAERRAREQAVADEVANQRRLAQMRGSNGVQIGAYRSERDAQAALRASSRFAPSFARGEVSRVETNDGVFFRARYMGLAASAARLLCNQITSGGASAQCQIIGN